MVEIQQDQRTKEENLKKFRKTKTENIKYKINKN